MNPAAGIHPAILAVELEQRGFDSVVPEHSHIPASRRSPCPAGGELPSGYCNMMSPLVSLATAASVTTDLVLATGITLPGARSALRAAWAGTENEPSSFNGTWDRFEPSYVNPKPTRGTIPIAMGNAGPLGMRHAAEFGAIVPASEPDALMLSATECRGARQVFRTRVLGGVLWPQRRVPAFLWRARRVPGWPSCWRRRCSCSSLTHR
jgi:alkanesulfonate monooxygenase SsuD/methylene tetrahydromethanopterin reductase-like flavin-dependent oxidoreductase (luciferase family)